MKKLFLTSLLAGATFVTVPAMAETETVTMNPDGTKTITSVVGYTEATIGRITVNGENYNGRGPLPKEAFMTLDNNGDGALTKKEMFANTHSNRGSSANFKTKDGRPGSSDYDVRGASGVKVEDLTANGTLFESMDVNNDGFVEHSEFRLDIRHTAAAPAPATPADIEPAAAEATIKTKAETRHNISSDPMKRANRSFQGHSINE